MARVDHAPTGPRGGTTGGTRPQGRLRPRIGLVLLVADPSEDLSGVIEALRGRGLRGVLSPLGKNVFHIVNEADPRAVVLRAGVSSWLELLGFLGRRGIATIVIGTPQQLRAAGESAAEPIGVLHPAEPIEIAETVELVVGSSSDDLPDTIDLGNLVIDVRGRAAVMGGRDLRLPPKEFDILVQLAIRAGEPIASIDLVRKVWPDNPRASIDDLHCRVKMLRDALGDRDPANRLLENRRGYGYVLNRAPIQVD
ncbi:MAG TPA: winged helix-turn-helix domain-containing protein [Actinomycetota bacterium]|nr:winged helix-turn-helix domain-containing protein [Actinomycetota bacterium]